MTDCTAPPDPHAGLVDRIAAWLFPPLYPDVPAMKPCIVEVEPEAEL
jgi:hypothetical protein